jgi:DNA-binding transcriptional regulator PaaX
VVLSRLAAAGGGEVRTGDLANALQSEAGLNKAEVRALLRRLRLDGSVEARPVRRLLVWSLPAAGGSAPASATAG